MVDVERASVKSYKGHTSRYVKKAKVALEDNEQDVYYLNNLLSTLEIKIEQLETAQIKYCTALHLSDNFQKDDDGSKEEKLIEEHGDFIDDCNVVALRLKRYTESITGENGKSTSTNQSTNASRPNHQIRLPQIQLERFDGSYTKWTSFWDCFQANIDSRGDIGDVDKLTYLKGTLDGNAKEKVANIPISSANYAKVVDMLTSTYANKDRIIWDQVYKLNKIKNPNHTFKDLDTFKTLVDSCLANLEVQGVDVDAGSYFLAPMIFQQLPFKVRESIQSRLGIDYPNLREIMSALGQVIVTLSSHATISQSSSNEKSSSNQATKGNSQINKDDYGKYGVGLGGVTKSEIGNFNVGVEEKAGWGKQTSKSCIFCKKSHSSTTCTKYQSRSAKLARATELGRCTKCFNTSHVTEDCKIKIKKCYICKKGVHHCYLCDQANNPAEEVKVSHSSIKHTKPTPKGTRIIPTASINLYTSKGMKNLRCMFDQGAQSSFIETDTVRDLGFKTVGKTRLSIHGFHLGKQAETYNIVQFKVKGNAHDITVKAVVVDDIPHAFNAPNIGKQVEKLKKLKVNLADPHIKGDCVDKIKILIGLDYYYQFFDADEVIGGINLINSAVGKVIAGVIPRGQKGNYENSITVNRLAVQEVNDTEPPIAKLWELDAIGINPSKYKPEENFAMAEFKKSIRYNENRYEVKLPWKTDRPQLPHHYGLAAGRLRSTLTKLNQVSEHLEVYNNIIQEQLKSGFIEVVENPKIQNCHYLPHMAVVRENSKTTPIRIVFDCSASLGKHSPSLNDCLLTGPSLTEELVKVLLRFRCEQYAFIADISKAFLRVGLNECDRDFTRFLWYKDPKVPNSEMVTYRFRSVLFGATCSPFLLQACLGYHFERFPDNPTASWLSKNFYVDNLQGCVESLDAMRVVYKESNKIMKEANMPLQEWVTNSPQLNEEIKEDGLNVSPDTESVKVLGIAWNYKSDTLHMKEVNYKTQAQLNKRDLLSEISKIFDPLGLVSPLVIRGKILMQKVWTLDYTWDSTLSEDIVKEWLKLKEDLVKVYDINIPRSVCNTRDSYELHTFCDASGKAFGAATYVVRTNGESNLIMSKSRVAPVAKKTIPQLELTSMVVGAKLGQYVRETLDHVKISDSYIWSDSEIAIQWVINNKSKDVYVKNRVEQIMSCGEFSFRHVGTKDNPADLISRGCSAKTIKKSDLWFHGPSWLPTTQNWPEQPAKLLTADPCSTIQITNIKAETSRLVEVSRFSSLPKLLNTVRYVLTFIRRLKSSIHPEQTSDLQTSECMQLLIKEVQQLHFSNEIKYCRGKTGKTPELTKTLNVYLDESGILRCKGRIAKSSLPLETVYPVVLPKKDKFTSLLIADRHSKVLHGGLQDTMVKLREEFWILQIRQAVKQIIKSCYLCRRLESPPFRLPISPDLPEYRVDKTLHPFEVTGVDLTGNIIIVNDETNSVDKYYITLFTCTVTRAVHLELIDSLSAEAFILAFRKFVARRGCPKLMLSDNATNFKAGSKIIQELFEKESVQVTLEKHRCKWQFIPARSPHFGGFYERLIGVVKNCLKKIIFKKKISAEELTALTCEIECRVNNRPLGYVDDDIDSLEPLTPAHLLYGRRLNALPTVTDKEYRTDPDYLELKDVNKSVRNFNKILNQFREVWQSHYLTSLREYQNFKASKNNSNRPSIKLNDVVLIHDEVPRTMWKLGRVIELLSGDDGITRVVKLKTQAGETMRSINKLYPLEIENYSNRGDETQVIQRPDINDDNIENRPQRKTALQNRKMIKSLIDKGSL